MKAALIWAAAGALITIYLCTFHNAANYSEDKWDQIYMDYVTDFRKSYDSVDMFAQRKEVFKANYLIMDTHNKNIERTYDMGLNVFSDWTQEEFESILKRQKPKTRTVTYQDIDSIATATPIDWEEQDKVLNVRDQGSCGSCWAFSATASLESAFLIAGKKLKYLSPQQLMDCSRKYGNAGCNGGLESNAFKYVEDKGIIEDKDYTYKAVDGSCVKDGGEFRITSHVDIPWDEQQVRAALLKQPLSVGVDATNWNRYAGGIFPTSGCRANINHGVELVGQDAEGNWRIKNSWGERYGEKGYIRLQSGNTCGIVQEAAYPVV